MQQFLSLVHHTSEIIMWTFSQNTFYQKFVSPLSIVRHVSTTKPLHRHYGLVVDTCLTKVWSRGSTVGQANAYLALSNFTPHPPPPYSVRLVDPLACFRHPIPIKPQHQPQSHTIPMHGATVHYVKPEGTSRRLSPAEKKFIISQKLWPLVWQLQKWRTISISHATIFVISTSHEWNNNVNIFTEYILPEICVTIIHC